MAKLPVVAIIGRPNVGKSTLFNRLIGQRKAIVSETPGTTRDHVSHRIEADDVDYLLIDTGGMGSTDDKDFEEDVFEQSLLALQHADLILFLIDGKAELTADDQRIVDLLRKKRKRHVPVTIVATKMDTPGKNEEKIAHLHELAIADELLPISAPHNLGIHELRYSIEKQLVALHFGKSVMRTSEETNPRIAIIGRPNVGKSSIVNALMTDSQRETSPLLVSDVAGTTRDSVDTLIRFNDKEYTLVDTAGIKKNTRNKIDIERYAMLRTVQAIESSDVVILVLSATEPVSQQDKRIAGLAIEMGKGLILFLNKMDTLKGKTKTEEKIREVFDSLAFCKFAPIIGGSAVTKDGLSKMFDIADVAYRNRQRRLSQKDLRQWFERSVYDQPLGEVARTKHIVQAKDVPPTFVLFVKDPKRVSVSQLRYMENRMRETFGFDGTPIRWITKGGEKKEEEEE